MDHFRQERPDLPIEQAYFAAAMNRQIMGKFRGK
jgi:hypothetical protein